MKLRILPILAVLLPLLSGIVTAPEAKAFCGFYVAKADVQLFNEASQVILVRDGNKTVVTMTSDFKGDVEDFAMVVPVPEVLKRENIRIAKSSLFERLDTYTAPRIAEYREHNPCQPLVVEEMALRAQFNTQVTDNTTSIKEDLEDDYKVTIEAVYDVEEYKILILSAEESDGLKRWLTDNDYKIPEGAEEVLDPYIKNGLKFFVVKVDVEKFKATGEENLRPLQIAFSSNRFMLPIRLGMANAQGDQDMIVYAFTRNGRVETANYRTVKLPTDRDVPEFVEQRFGQFYVDLFNRAWHKEGGKSVLLEYAWDISSSNYVKCDPCPTTPPDYTELREAGVFWVNSKRPQWGGANYDGDVFVTRLHVRYNRQNYPQDLMFTATPNKESFQGRYVIHRPAKGDFDCDEATAYLENLVERRQAELDELTALTGWDTSNETDYVDQYRKKLKGNNRWIQNDFENNEEDRNGTGVTGIPPADKWHPGAPSAIMLTITALLMCLGVVGFLALVRSMHARQRRAGLFRA